VTITTLKDLLNIDIDMVTTIIVGNSATKVVNGKMVTARGYDLFCSHKR
jgi:precorrin-3B C17-methyltransferase